MLQWPANILAPRKVMVDPVYANMGGGRSITAIEQIVSADAGYWQITLDEIPFITPLQKQTARAISVQLEGRLNPIDVPIYDSQSAPSPYVHGVLLGRQGNVPFADGAPFDDRALFVSGVINAVVVGDVDQGDVTMSIDLIVGGSLQPGQHFSVQGATQQRLYRIKTATLTSGTTYSCKVYPPVREDIADGTVAEFDDPRLTCRLMTDTEMQSFVDDYAGRTTAKVNFVEMLP